MLGDKVQPLKPNLIYTKLSRLRATRGHSLTAKTWAISLQDVGASPTARLYSFEEVFQNVLRIQ